MHWADVIAAELLSKSKKHRIATGISPSGHIHLGNLREMVTADAVRRALIDAGGEAEIVYIADDFDPLRRRYPFLPAEYENYVGMPLCKIPDPEGCHESYSEHFLQPFLESLDILGIPVILKKAHEMYEAGYYTDAIRLSLQKRDEIAKIISEVTGREEMDDWYPFMPLCKSCGRINTTKVVSFDEKRIYYRCKCGDESYVSYEGGGKLTWRLDWVSRWKILQITCEPFGKDHAAAGGSYDTGVRLAREIFNYEPPYPIPYEWVQLKGLGPMKSSKGIVIPVRQIIDIIPPEVVRYLFMRVKPERHIDFDPSATLELFEEFEEKFAEKDRSVQLSLVKEENYSIPFKHIIIVGQIANWEMEKCIEILKRTGQKIDEKAKKELERKLNYAKMWVENYAPDRIKFRIAENIEVEFSESERRFICEFAKAINESMSADEIHTSVYEVAKKVGIDASKAFQAIYKLTLNKNYGPRAGYFIKSLGVDWFKERAEKICQG